MAIDSEHMVRSIHATAQTGTIDVTSAFFSKKFQLIIRAIKNGNKLFHFWSLFVRRVVICSNAMRHTAFHSFAKPYSARPEWISNAANSTSTSTTTKRKLEDIKKKNNAFRHFAVLTLPKIAKVVVAHYIWVTAGCRMHHRNAIQLNHLDCGVSTCARACPRTPCTMTQQTHTRPHTHTRRSTSSFILPAMFGVH